MALDSEISEPSYFLRSCFDWMVLMILKDRHPPSTLTAVHAVASSRTGVTEAPSRRDRGLDPQLDRELQTRLAKRSAIADVALDATVDAVAYVAGVNVGQDGE